jgi:hypothetical protein
VARPASILFAAAFLVGHAITAFLLVFWATFPFENQSADEAANDDWLIGVGVGVLVVGFVVALGTLFAQRWAVVAYAMAAVAGVHSSFGG